MISYSTMYWNQTKLHASQHKIYFNQRLCSVCCIQIFSLKIGKTYENLKNKIQAEEELVSINTVYRNENNYINGTT